MCDNDLETNMKICFIGVGTCFLLSNRESKNIIGPDIQQFILGRELIKNNFIISFICHEKSIKNFDVHVEDEFKLIHVKYEDCKFKLLKYLKILFNNIKSVKIANADVYIHHGGIEGLIPLLLRKKCILSIASDAFIDQSLIKTNSKEFKKSLFSFVSIANWINIKWSNSIIVQNEFQKNFLRENFGIDANLIKIPFYISNKTNIEKTSPGTVLWVGAMAKVKQPQLFVKLAKEMPDIKFQMIGGHYNNVNLFNYIKKQASHLDNLDFMGVVPFNEINDYFRKASVFVNTSVFEGFPNSFVQSWMNFTPVITLNVDPDGIIIRNNMGFQSKNYDQLKQDLYFLLENEELRGRMGFNGRQYVEKEHDISKIISQYCELFESI